MAAGDVDGLTNEKIEQWKVLPISFRGAVKCADEYTRSQCRFAYADKHRNRQVFSFHYIFSSIHTAAYKMVCADCSIG